MRALIRGLDPNPLIQTIRGETVSYPNRRATCFRKSALAGMGYGRSDQGRWLARTPSSTSRCGAAGRYANVRSRETAIRRGCVASRRNQDSSIRLDRRGLRQFSRCARPATLRICRSSKSTSRHSEPEGRANQGVRPDAARFRSFHRGRSFSKRPWLPRFAITVSFAGFDLFFLDWA